MVFERDKEKDSEVKQTKGIMVSSEVFKQSRFQYITDKHLYRNFHRI